MKELRSKVRCYGCASKDFFWYADSLIKNFHFLFGVHAKLTTLSNTQLTYDIKELTQEVLLRHQQKETHIMDLLKTKYQWMVTEKWDFLHFVKEISDWDDAFWEKQEAQFDGFRWTTACGLQEILEPPGIPARMSRPRCDVCCDAIGLSPGKGCPVNDKSCENNNVTK